MLRFEYLQLDVTDDSNPVDWNGLGGQGWELVTIHRDIAYFKRWLDYGSYVVTNYPNVPVSVQSYPTFGEPSGWRVE